MRNIYSRSKFKKINEDSSNVKDVANVSNEPVEIVKAWNLSLVGAVTNFFVGGVLKGLKAIYKMGRKAWAMRNLTSKLNKEYLKGLIFFLDSKNIDTTGELTEKGKEEQTDQADTTVSDTIQVQDKSATALTEIQEILANINTIEEFNANPEIKEWRETLQVKLEERKNKWSDAHLKKYEDDVNNARTKAEKDQKQKILNRFLKGQPGDDSYIGKEEFDKDFEQVKQINELIDKKENELKSVTSVLNNLKKVIPDFNPTDEVDNIKLDYPKYKSLKSNDLTKDKIAIGDKFTVYKAADNKRETVTIIKKKDTEEGVVTVATHKNPSGVGMPVAKFLPSSFSGFKVLSEMEKFLLKYGRNYNSLDDENKQVILNVYKKYLIFKEIKKDMVEVGHLSESLLLEKQLKVKGKGSGFMGAGRAIPGVIGGKGSVEGGDLKSGTLQGDIPLKQILSNKDIERLKNPSIADRNVGDIKYGEIIKKFKAMETKDYSPKTEVAKNVNKYNLEVIKLLANKEFADDKSQKEWATKVNKVNGYWNELINIDMVNVLSNIKFSSDGSLQEKINNESSKLDIQDDLGVLENSNLLGSPIDTIKSLGENNVILSFIVKKNGEKYILPGKGISWKLDNVKKLVNVKTNLAIVEKDGKKTYEPDINTFVGRFQKQNANVFIGEKDVSSYSPTINTYFLMDIKQKIPKDLTVTQSGDIIIINEITYTVGSNKQTEICFFDFDKKRNYNINNVKTPPKVKINLVCINLIKDVNNEKLTNLGLTSVSSTIRDNVTEITKALEPKKENK